MVQIVKLQFASLAAAGSVFAGAALLGPHPVRPAVLNYAIPCHQARLFGAPSPDRGGPPTGTCTGSGIPCEAKCRSDGSGGSWNLVPVMADIYVSGTSYSTTCTRKNWEAPNSTCANGYDSTSTYNPPNVCWWSDE